MRRPAPLAFLLVGGAVGAAAVLVGLVVALAPAPPTTAACGAEPATPDYVPVPAHETRLAFLSIGGDVRVTVWANASAPYALYLQSAAQYLANAANASTPNGSVYPAPPSQFVWASGPSTATNVTFVLGSDDWYLLVTDLEAAPLSVHLVAVGCLPT